MSALLGVLAALSCLLGLWQWAVARRFPLHRRAANRLDTPAVTLLKPLKGCDGHTEACLRSWFEQCYGGSVQLLFGVAVAEDPVCALARRLIAEYPQADADLVVCGEPIGPNAKVSTLVHLQARATHGVLVISDADVRVPPDLLANVVAPLRDSSIGLVNCFYQLSNAATAAMRWEAIAVNADFWSQVLQSRSLQPLDFALGAVMAIRRRELDRIGGFRSLLDYLADDYQLGNKIVRLGTRIELCPVVVACCSEPLSWRQVWKHQLRWARTIRVCQPLPFFFSILSNGTCWPLAWVCARPSGISLSAAVVCLVLRLLTARSNYRRLTGEPLPWFDSPLVFWKDLAGLAIWALAFLGNRIEWRGIRYHMGSDGRLEPLDGSPTHPVSLEDC